MFDTLILALIWTFNLSALALTFRADWLRRVVLSSWELIVFLVIVELAWSIWALWTGQPAPVVMAACWLGINLFCTVNVARRQAERLASGQIVLLCSWWMGLLGMVMAALQQARTA